MREFAIVGGIMLAILAFGAVASYGVASEARENATRFKAVCADAGGITVHDGRQFVCIIAGRAS